MESAATIRMCSKIMMVITIIASFVSGIAIMVIDYNYLVGLPILVVGVFSGIMMNALFQGFADIIDNTYAIALNANGVEVSKKTQKNSGDISFQEASKVNKEKKEYADELLSKGLISQEEYEKMTR